MVGQKSVIQPCCIATSTTGNYPIIQPKHISALSQRGVPNLTGKGKKANITSRFLCKCSWGGPFLPNNHRKDKFYFNSIWNYEDSPLAWISKRGFKLLEQDLTFRVRWPDLITMQSKRAEEIKNFGKESNIFFHISSVDSNDVGYL